MTLVLTLLCRDEADILEPMLRFHLERGVDPIIATDNGSVDGSLEILQRLNGADGCGCCRNRNTPMTRRWVTRMARMAAELGAEWVIHSDADEFWWPHNGDLNRHWPHHQPTSRPGASSDATCCHRGGTTRTSGRSTGARPCWSVSR